MGDGLASRCSGLAYSVVIARGIVSVVCLPALIGGKELCHAEVEQLGRSVGGDENVGRLYVRDELSRSMRANEMDCRADSVRNSFSGRGRQPGEYHR